MSKRVTCFVISPMGKPESGIRGDVQDVWKNILLPAKAIAEQKTGLSIDAKPEFENLKPRDIVQDIVRRIIYDDLIIAILHGTNPNVMYELGIAHSAGREVLILYHEESNNEKLVFDINTRLRFVYSDMHLRDGRSAVKRDLVRQVADAMAAQIEAELAPDARAHRVAFSNPTLDALGSRHLGYHLIRKISGSVPYENLPYPQWAEFFDAADAQIGLMGVSLLQLLDSSNDWILKDGRAVSFSTFLKFKALYEGVQVRLVIMHEDNRALPGLLRGVVAGDDAGQLERVRNEIRRSTMLWLAHAKEVADAAQPDGRPPKGSIRLFKLRRGVINDRLSLTDRAVIVTPIFLHVEKNSIGPALWAASTTSIYRFFLDHFEFLIEHNPPESDAVTSAAAPLSA